MCIRDSLSSRFGSLGTLLLDPTNVTIEDGGSAAATAVDAFADAGTNVSIDADTLDAAKGNVTIQATADITVDEAIALTTSGATLTLTAKDDIILNQNISTTNGAINLTPGDDLTLTGTVNSGSAATKIELYDGGYISLGDNGDCEENTCTMPLSSTNLAQITSTGLTIGGTNTDNIYLSEVSEAATDNVSGTVTLNATGSSLSEIIFGTGDDVMANFYALTTNSRSGTYLDSNITITTGDYNGTANSNSDWDETTGNGEFVLGTGITLNMTGGGDVSFTGAPIYEWGTITGAGTFTTNGTVLYIDVDDLLMNAIDSANRNGFLDELDEMATGFMKALGGGGNC